MANMVSPDEGLVLLTQMAFGSPGSITEDFVVDLYSNNYTPVYGSTGTNFTAATFTGYAQASVSRSSFGSATASAGVASITSSATPTFNCTGGSGQTLYGWFMRGVTSGKVYAAELFSTAIPIVNGGEIQLTPFTIELEPI